MAYQCIYFKKDFNGYYDKVLQPASQFINPEWAHKIGVSALKYGLFPAECYEDPKVLVSFPMFKNEELCFQVLCFQIKMLQCFFSKQISFNVN